MSLNSQQFIIMGVDKWANMGITLIATQGPCTACSWGVGPFWGSTDLQFTLGIILVAWDATTGSVICFSVCGVWSSTCIIQHTNTPIITLIDYGARLLMELGFIGPLNLTPRHNHCVLAMIKHFSKWLELMPLLDYSNEGVACAFLNKMFNMFGVPTEAFTNQGK